MVSIKYVLWRIEFESSLSVKGSEYNSFSKLQLVIKSIPLSVVYFRQTEGSAYPTKNSQGTAQARLELRWLMIGLKDMDINAIASNTLAG